MKVSQTLAASSTRKPALGLRLVLVTLALLACLLGELSWGAVSIPLHAVVTVFAGGEINNPAWHSILLEFRLPRALMALFCGASLGVAGLMLQTLFRNPLADPYVLGLVHGGRLGAATIVVLAGLLGNAYLQRFGITGEIGTALASVAGVGCVLAILSKLSRTVGMVTLLVSGLMLGYLCTGLISILMHFVDEHQARAFKIWDDASFAGATWPQLRLIIPASLIGIGAAWGLSKPLDALLLGERYAQSLGTDTQRVRTWALIIIAWLCGIVTAFCGPIAFVGIVSAQFARALCPVSRHNALLPSVALCGATLALAADWFTHLPWEKEVFHLNAVIGLVGAPLALWVLHRSRSLRGFEG